jgi:hypothetical protein
LLDGRQREESQVRRNWIYIALLLTATFVATLVLIVWGKKIADHLHPEVFKLLAGLVITAGIGGIASLILNEINASRERREAGRALRRNTLTDVVTSYNEVKGIRRQLRAEAVRPTYSDPNAYVLREPYATLLQRLNSAQLKLESHLRLIEGNESQYPEPKRLLQRLGEAESYLGNLISEWEEKLGRFGSEPHDNMLCDFLILRCFVSEAKQSFKPGFATPIAEVFSILGRSIGR